MMTGILLKGPHCLAYTDLTALVLLALLLLLCCFVVLVGNHTQGSPAHTDSTASCRGRESECRTALAAGCDHHFAVCVSEAEIERACVFECGLWNTREHNLCGKIDGLRSQCTHRRLDPFGGFPTDSQIHEEKEKLK